MDGTTRTKDFFTSPALSLSLAGVFRNAAPVEEEVEVGDEESGGRCRGEAVEISSENTRPGGRSDEDGDTDRSEGGVVGEKRKRRKKYHRHTAEQIREMEALFKESPHPDEQQRQRLSKQLGLAPRQVKFWFQNRRTQIKAIQERHEKLILKSEMEKLREENRRTRDSMKKSCCPNCGTATSNKDIGLATEEQMLRIENARLKAEIERLRETQGAIGDEATSPGSSWSGGTDHGARTPVDLYSGVFGLEKSRILEILNRAMDEVLKMATANEPLWVRSVETGREILNYDEYAKEFSPSVSSNGPIKQSIEASRETSIVFLDIARLLQAFMDVNQWKEMFACMISKAATVDVLFSSERGSRDGTIQLMFAELQMLTPLVPTRELYFVRYCKQLSPNRWAIVDVSIDKFEESIDISLAKCRKWPSGCVIEDQANGHCKVSWVEHVECRKGPIPTMYRSMVNNGLAFGARHWMAALQAQCERMLFFMATNVPKKDSNGVYTLAGRKSILQLAQRMTSGFCHAIGASRYPAWTKLSAKGGEDIRFTSRKNISDPGEPLGVILCAVSSTWLPVPATALFDLLRDGSRRTEWDVMLNGGPTQSIVNIAKGQDRGNAVALHETKSTERSSRWVLQDSCTSAYESMVVFAPVDVDGMQLVMTGCDSSSMAVLPSGFSILSDGHETRPLVITSRREEESAMGGGSLLTVSLQILADVSPAAKVAMDSVETVSTLISCTMYNLRRIFKCEDV